MKPAPIPKAITVGPHTYKVRRVRKLVEDLGLCSYDTATVSIRQGMGASKTREVLLHEVLHACGYPSLCDKDEEFVDTIAPALLQVLRSNPELLAYLTT